LLNALAEAQLKDGNCNGAKLGLEESLSLLAGEPDERKATAVASYWLARALLHCGGRTERVPDLARTALSYYQTETPPDQERVQELARILDKAAKP
jgi:hypothetical protein